MWPFKDQQLGSGSLRKKTDQSDLRSFFSFERIAYPTDPIIPFRSAQQIEDAGRAHASVRRGN
jgi:hypothetical protein